MERVALFPGSFDPFTRGHQAIVEQGLALFERVVVAVGYNPNKRGLLDVEARCRLIERVYASEPRVKVVAYSTLTGDEARRQGAQVLLRSVRTTADYEYERTLAQANAKLYPELRTILVFVPAEVEHISSSLVRELHTFGRDTSEFLPVGVRLEEYLNKE